MSDRFHSPPPSTVVSLLASLLASLHLTARAAHHVITVTAAFSVLTAFAVLAATEAAFELLGNSVPIMPLLVRNRGSSQTTRGSSSRKKRETSS